jgi:hypothetical protein
MMFLMMLNVLLRHFMLLLPCSMANKDNYMTCPFCDSLWRFASSGGKNEHGECLLQFICRDNTHLSLKAIELLVDEFAANVSDGAAATAENMMMVGFMDNKNDVHSTRLSWRVRAWMLCTTC